jgi:CRP/FNR family cyclic AMP-dependent transcriptional regulator
MPPESTITRPAKSVAETVSVLAVDPELAADLDPGAAEEATRAALARVVALEAGPAASLPGGPGDLGLLVLSGLLIRTVGIEDRRFAELLGPGDLLRPWDQSSTLVPHESAFRVMERTRVAVLDRRFAFAMAAWPPVLVALVARTMQRARSLAMHLAVCHMRGVEQRLLVVLWHLADRWGRVAPDGVVLDLRLTHETLANVVGARRPTVTLGLQHLAADALVLRRADGRFVLRGDPPGYLDELRAQTSG